MSCKIAQVVPTNNHEGKVRVLLRTLDIVHSRQDCELYCRQPPYVVGWNCVEHRFQTDLDRCYGRLEQAGVEMTTSPPTVYICDDVRRIIRLHQDLLTAKNGLQPIARQLNLQAVRLLEAHASGNRAVLMHLQSWHPRLVSCTSDEIMATSLTIVDARVTMAREYGFADWSDVELRGAVAPDAPFEAAIETLLDGDIDSLRQMLRCRPELTQQRSMFGHRATLLHYVGSNGVESHRQKVPSNLADIARILLAAGADVNARADMYGGATTLGLLLTSCHPAQAGVADEVAQALLEFGAIAG